MKSPSRIISRIGTCRSRRQFDLPYDFEESEIFDFYSQLPTEDRIDIFCMFEAMTLIIAKEDHFYSDGQKASIEKLTRLILVCKNLQ